MYTCMYVHIMIYIYIYVIYIYIYYLCTTVYIYLPLFRRQDPVGSPLERIAMDILSLPVESQAGNTCILVVSDYFTKWAEAFALPDHRAITVADALVTEVFLRYGTPRIIH